MGFAEGPSGSGDRMLGGVKAGVIICILEIGVRPPGPAAGGASRVEGQGQQVPVTLCLWRGLGMGWQVWEGEGRRTGGGGRGPDPAGYFQFLLWPCPAKQLTPAWRPALPEGGGQTAAVWVFPSLAASTTGIRMLTT